MTKMILSASGAFISLLCAIVLLTAFAKTGEALIAILAVFSAFGVLSFIGYGIDGTKAADFISNLFAEGEVRNE